MVTTIFPVDRDDARTLARALLDAAGPDRHDEVTTVAQGALGIAYEVPEDLAAVVLGTSRPAEGGAVGVPGEGKAPEVPEVPEVPSVGSGADTESVGSGAETDGVARRPSKAARARAGASS